MKKIEPKILVTNPMSFSKEQIARLKKLGKVKFHNSHPETADEWLKRCQGYKIICSWMFGLREKYHQLKDAFITVPFVGVGSFADPSVLKTNNITLCNAPGSNRHAVSEWIIFMILMAMRKLGKYTNTEETLSFPLSDPTIGLAGKNITILGKGNVGKRVGQICSAFEMNVTYFKRGDDLKKAVKNAYIVVNVLSSNPDSKGLLDKKFFNSLKKGSVFITVTADEIIDIEAMLKAVNTGRLFYIAHDVMSARPADSNNPFYIKLQKHPKIFATPHIAGFSDVTNKIGNDMMIDNLEAYLKGKPINVFGR